MEEGPNSDSCSACNDITDRNNDITEKPNYSFRVLRMKEELNGEVENLWFFDYML